ncbi:5009_t:CDS:2 [Entrophospora sp. SA101]|nr:4611_t:CDS:2 [Entrophospora sp. SA101]CAJ0748209.1 5009_t:CDS:2 [Entrophospora sp. SA101]
MSTFVSSNEFVVLREFLKNEPFERITISRALHKLWSDSGIQTEEIDCECLTKNLGDVAMKSNDEKRKQHLESLKDGNKIRFIWKELKALMLDADLLGSKPDQSDWKSRAVRNINSLKDAIRKQKNVSLVHADLFRKIGEVNIDNLSQDDPLVNSVIDLGSNWFQLSEEDQGVLVGEKVAIKRLSKDDLIKRVCSKFIANRDKIRHPYKFVVMTSEVLTHDHWVEQEDDRKQVASDITDVLLQKLKSNVLHRVTYGSESAFVEIMAQLIEASLYKLPIEYDVEVTRSERQSMASKNHKVQENIGKRGDKPDLMIRAFFRQKQNEIVYVESGKWECDDKKIHDDHNKLVKLCSCGYDEIVKKTPREQLHKFYIAFGINIAGDRLILHGLVHETGVKYYLPITEAKIPFRDESVEEIEEFVHILMTLRNGIIVNLHNFGRIFMK